MKVICISGSVGTGKTTLAKRLAKKLSYKYIDINKIIKEQNLREKYDRKRKCYVIDTKKLNKALISHIKLLNKPLPRVASEPLLAKKICGSVHYHKMRAKNTGKKAKKEGI